MNIYVNDQQWFNLFAGSNGRFISVLPMAAIITISLFLIMKFMVTLDMQALPEKEENPRFDINPVVEEKDPRIRDEKIKREVEVTPPPALPQIEKTVSSLPTASIANSSWAIPNLDKVGIAGMQAKFKIDRDIQPIFRSNPAYPLNAQARNLEGNCSAVFDVGINGSPFNIKVNCTASVFERSARNAISKWKYNPKIANGKAVIMYGVKNSIKYKMAD
ncbi:MAG: energy transducer TonB [Robiginitomaculum sp.]|nr:energy transducer TonB [Robiginitomaculum sp.]